MSQMRVRPVLVASSSVLIALAGCGERKEESRNMTANEVAAELRNVEVEPGLWESVTRIVSVSAPNLPVEARNSMMRPSAPRRNCITPEQAARPDANFFNSAQNSDCTYRDFTMRGGRMQGTMTCTGGGMPGTMTTSMTGEYGPRSYDITLRMQTGGMPQGGDMTFVARTRGRHVGECPAGGEEETKQ